MTPGNGMKNKMNLSQRLSLCGTKHSYLLEGRPITYLENVLIIETSMVSGLWEELSTLFLVGFCIILDH